MVTSPHFHLMMMIPTLAYRGAERVISEISCHLPVTIQQTLVLFEDQVTYPHQARVHILGGYPPLHIPAQCRTFFHRRQSAVKLVHETKPDIILSFTERANLLNLAIPARTNRPPMKILSVRSLLSQSDELNHGLYGFFYRQMVRFLYPRADHIVAVSPGVQRDLEGVFRLPPHKLTCIANPVSLTRIRHQMEAEASHPWFSERIPIIMSMGSLRVEKNYPLLIHAFAKVHKKTRCRLVIAGEGPLLQTLQYLTHTLNIHDDVHFTGFLGNPFSYLKHASFSVLSSNFEGFPNAILEALAVGCPALSTICSTGVAELFSPGEGFSPNSEGWMAARYGILCRRNHVDAMTSAMQHLLKNSHVRDQYRGRGPIRASDFSPEIIIAQYVGLFEDIINLRKK